MTNSHQTVYSATTSEDFPYQASDLGPLPIEHRSDQGVAHEIAVGEKKQGGRYQTDEGEF